MNEYSQSARAADRARVIELDAQIHELQAQVRVLQLEREPCKQRLDTYKYPVLTLPNEITSEIFLHFLTPYPDCPPLRGLDSPTSLTHICRKWREIALATPMLWRALSIEEPDDRAGVVQTWLDRSGSCPLSIKLEHDIPGVGSLNESLIAMLLYRERWQHVQLALRAQEVVLLGGPMPLLESLSLTVDRWYYGHPVTSAADFPRLRSVTLDDADHGNWLPLSQLTTLTLNEVSGTNYFALLRGAVNLVYLCLIRCIHAESGHTLTRLETLVVVDRLGRRQTLDMLTLPALLQLQWSRPSDAPGFWNQNHIDSLTSLISRSGCKLQQILLTGASELSQESLRAALPSVPKVALDSEYDWYPEQSRGFKDGLGLGP
ncbi:hypothetical protein FB45DRAFT_899668 [Roridomyces roridus]|uniref:F-box domain-containing protein n=1 Tax=Roridomyces roridus TaxID=1738132 RepID=A0AAD7C7F6_9AGAR|nr:hypothetical protein FB45DRAFT_899668 [Roridomyces roridus]